MSWVISCPLPALGGCVKTLLGEMQLLVIHMIYDDDDDDDDLKGVILASHTGGST